MAADALAGLLARLLTDGAVPASQVSARSRRSLQPLSDSGVLEEVRVGGGRRLEVRDRAALERYARKLYPSGLGGVSDPGLPPRSAAVGGLRNAKRARSTDAEPLLLQGFGGAVLRRGEQALEVAAWSRAAGLAAIRLDAHGAWEFAGTVAVVENLEVFLHLERLALDCDLAVYAAGRLSRRALAWLASPPMADCSYVHCGDYDPVGLEEYLRLAATCPGRTRLYVPDHLEQLLATYGKAELLRASADRLGRLRDHPDPQVKQLVSWMDRYGVGLEQEALLLELGGEVS